MQELIHFMTQHAFLSIAAIIVFLLLMLVEFLRVKRSGTRLTPAQAIQMMNHNHAVIVDIRSEEQYHAGHIIDAVLIPYKAMKELTKKLEKFKTKPIIIVCQTGVEAQKVAAILLKQGYNVYTLAGGMRTWHQAEMPLIKEKV